MLRVVTYNVHKCVGLDRRRSVERIARVLEQIDADIVALQEVECQPSLDIEDGDQATALARRLGLQVLVGPAVVTETRVYGNVVLTRLPVTGFANYDISSRRREPRSCMRVDLETRFGPLHFYNTHFGTSYRERCEQSHRLLRTDLLAGSHPEHPQVLVGDFNDWFPGEASRLLGDHLHDLTRHIRPTYPSGLPLLRLDRIYVNRRVRGHPVSAHLTPLARIASDHVPIVAALQPA